MPRGTTNNVDGRWSPKTELVIFGAKLDLIRNLEQHSKSLPFIHYQPGHGPEATAAASLDAMWASPMVGVELFGATPPFPLHEANVLVTPRSQIERGLPRYGIVGVATAEDDPKTPEYVLRLKLGALLRSVRRFNAENEDQIYSVGILFEDLEFNRLDPETAFRIVRDVYDRNEDELDC